MNVLATIGQEDTTIQYTDRPTVKVVVKKDNKLIVIDEGTLPGGGVDPGESDQDAITRELQEELGATVSNVHEVGTVIQYRNLINKKYFVNGYTAELETEGGPTNPQSEREAQFTTQWLTLDEAMAYVSKSVDKLMLMPMDDATIQGRLYNLMTVLEILKAIRQ